MKGFVQIQFPGVDFTVELNDEDELQKLNMIRTVIELLEQRITEEIKIKEES